MKKKTLAILFTILLLVLSACSNQSPTTSASSGETYEFKLTHITQPSHIWQKFAEKLSEELETRSDGRMKLEIYPAAQLGPEADMVQQLENGSIDFAVITVPYLSSRIPALDAWNMPFLFDSLEASIEAQELEPAKKMLDLLDEQNLKGMGYMFAANHNLVLKDQAINSVEDVDGLKVRFTGGPSVLEYWKGLGSSPIAMGLNEVYSALQTGVIEGVSVDTNALLSEKFYENADHYVLTNHMAFPGVIVGSKKVYEEMSPEDQKIVDESIKAAADWGKEQVLSIEKENIEKLKDLIEVSELADRQSFIEEAQVIYDKYSAENELIKEFIEAVQK